MEKDKKFFDRVYAVVREIPRGKVATYGQIAKILGVPTWSQVIGYALHANAHPDLKSLEAAGVNTQNIKCGDKEPVPCHRVVNRYGQTCIGFAFGGGQIQRKMLENEGVEFDKNGLVNMDKHLWRPSL